MKFVVLEVCLGLERAINTDHVRTIRPGNRAVASPDHACTVVFNNGDECQVYQPFKVVVDLFNKG